MPFRECQADVGEQRSGGDYPRARDYLLVTCAGVPSEFLLDLNPAT